MKKLMLGILLFCIQLQLSAQCLKEVALQQRSIQSTLVIEGRVIARHSFWNEDATMIYTSNTIEVFKVFKGSISSVSIDILTPGGIVGDRMIRANPSLSLSKGETGIFICEPVTRFKALPANTSGIPRYEAYASVQGFIKYDLKERSASDPFHKYYSIENELYKVFSPANDFIVVKPFSLLADAPVIQRIQAITNFSPTTITAGTGSVLTINGTAFGATQGSGFVEFKNGDDGGATYINPLASQYLSWSNTQITVEVPTAACTGTIQVTQGVTVTSATNLTVNYSHLNVDFDPGSGTVAYQTDHINDNGLGGYTWRMNTGFNSNAVAKASFLRAFNSWQCGTQVNWSIGTTTAINDAVSDGTNIICFDNTVPLPPGVLGVCYSYWSGCASGPTIIWFVSELDIIFDEGSNIAPLTWQFGTAAPTGSQYDFETVAVHELGHGHQLGHVNSPGAIMHFALSNGVSNRALGVNDLAGGNFVKSKSVVANICGPGAMTAIVCAPLPLTITSVRAYQKGKDIQVEWVNASESDLHHYEVEESEDARLFTKAAIIAPKANNNGNAGYEWLDRQVSNGGNFYRVKAVGNNGDIKYSAMVRVDLTGNLQVFSVYPNPVRGSSFTAKINNLSKGIYTLTMYNDAGQLVLNKTVVHGGGNASEGISLPAIATGVYRLQLQGNGQLYHETLVIEIKN